MHDYRIPLGLCLCGCGQATNIAKRNRHARGEVKGQPQRFLPGHAGSRPGMTLAERFWEKVDKDAGPGECWGWTGYRDPNGYGRIYVSPSVRTLASRVSWDLHFGAIPDGLYVLHICDNPPCCNPAHLFLGTHADNMADMTAKGRRSAPTGEAHGSAKITEAQVREIRALVAGGMSQTEIGRRYGLHNSVVCRLVSRKTWAHVT